MATFFCPQGREVRLYSETILSCWKVMTVLAVFFLLLEIVEPQRKQKKKGKQNKAPMRVSLGDTTFH